MNNRRASAVLPDEAGRLRLLLRLALLLSILTLLLPGTLAAQGMEVSLPVGTEAPDVELEDLDGNLVQLSDLTDGKPAVIEFWASWCKDCEALMPQMKEIHARGDVSVVAVAVGVGQSLRRVRRHLDRDDPGYPHLWDGEGAAV